MRAALRTAMLQGVPLSTRDLYNTPITTADWSVPTAGAARFSWEYDDGRDRLLALYQKGKDKQWDAQKRIDWDLEVDPVNVAGLPDEFNPLFGSDIWDKMTDKEHDEFGIHQG